MMSDVNKVTYRYYMYTCSIQNLNYLNYLKLIWFVRIL